MSKLMDRIGGWIGLWRGPIALQDGRKGMAEFQFTSFFAGSLVELVARSIDLETGESQAWGVAHIAPEQSGRMVWRQFNQRIGFATLHETEAEEGSVTVQGPLAAGEHMTVSVRQTADELAVTVSAGAPDGPKSVTRMRRVGQALKVSS